MSYIQFSKSQLQNLRFSLEREVIQSNKKGAYSSSSLSNCNTRKYHGLLVASQPTIDDNKYVFISSLDETIYRENMKISLGMHHYPEVYYPQGYLHIEEFTYDRVPQWLIKADDILIQKEIMLSQDEENIYILYTVMESLSPFYMHFNPYLNFRNIHTVSKFNDNIEKKTVKITNGISIKLYPKLSTLYLQCSSPVEFINQAEWNYNNIYIREQERGYEFTEDLFCPGYFRIPVKNGDQFIFSAGLTEMEPKKLKPLFTNQLKKHPILENFQSCLENSAKNFIIQNKQETEIAAGYHWFGSWSRDTFISLPGLTLSTHQPKLFKAVIENMLLHNKGGQFPNIGKGMHSAFNSVDASLWFFWAIQQYAHYTQGIAKIWTEYGTSMQAILNAYKKELKRENFPYCHKTHMTEEGLLYSEENGLAITWMDAMCEGKAITSRVGLIVEINALWYNAIQFSLEAASYAKDQKFIDEWQSVPAKIEDAFNKYFWSEERGYLADYVSDSHSDWSLRPNQLIAASLPYSPIDYIKQKSILKITLSKLLTPRGLRTLSPDDPKYIGHYGGDQKTRDMAYHQGTVWPWLIGPLADVYLKVYPDKASEFLQSIINNFETAVFEYGIGSIAEIYDGNEPHKADGTIAQAWSVSELLRVQALINETRQTLKNNIKREVSQIIH